MFFENKDQICKCYRLVPKTVFFYSIVARPILNQKLKTIFHSVGDPFLTFLSCMFDQLGISILLNCWRVIYFILNPENLVIQFSHHTSVVQCMHIVQRKWVWITHLKIIGLTTYRSLLLYPFCSRRVLKIYKQMRQQNHQKIPNIKLNKTLNNRS